MLTPGPPPPPRAHYPAFGRVYRGCWRGSAVAVKVVDGWDSGGGGDGAAPQEVALSEALRHPNLVKTLAYAFKSDEVQGWEEEEEEGGEQGGASDSLRQHWECWAVQVRLAALCTAWQRAPAAAPTCIASYRMRFCGTWSLTQPAAACHAASPGLLRPRHAAGRH